MLINGQRELAYVAKVTEILPIEGADRVEIAKINGWTCMVGKGTFKVGDLGVFFEADSKVPATENFAFMEKRDYKVKVQKFFKGTVISDGLLMPFADLDLDAKDYKEGQPMTKQLGVVYYVTEDNKRKSNGDKNAKYQSMAARHPKLFKNKLIRKIYKTELGKKILFLFFGKKTDKPNAFPYWVVKTDEERIQNLTMHIPEYKNEFWWVTEKVDGSSSTFTLKREKGNKRTYVVCSRNVAMKPDSKNFYTDLGVGNIYIEMSNKYNIESILNRILDSNPDVKFVTLQGEIYGKGVQRRDYSIEDHDLRIFNVILGYDNEVKRLNPDKGKKFVESFDLKYVPVLGHISFDDFNTCEDFLNFARGASEIDGLPREGLVFRNEDATKSFKAVDPEFIMTFHG